MIRSTSTSIKTVRAVSELRAALMPSRRSGRTIGLVPTMGALHDGHLSLIERARAQCDVVVVSLFVNPSQFDERSDLERYPRDEARDRELAERAGADILFAPSAEEVYPAGFATSVEVLGLTDRLEGAVRGAPHFRGVTTVVTKLLNMVAARRRLLRPEGRPAGRSSSGAWSPTSNLPVRIEACADRARARRPGDVQPQRAAARPRSARALSPCSAALCGGRGAGRRRRALRRGPTRGRAHDDGRASTSSPSTSRSSIPPRSSRSSDWSAPPCSAVAARVGQTRLIDNV